MSDARERTNYGPEEICRDLRQRAVEHPATHDGSQPDRCHYCLGIAAADEIERLREKVAFVQRAYEKSKTGNPHDQDEQYRNLLAFAVAVRTVLDD